ncbi:MAG: hypothetical protein LBK95_08190 [Bifidobacteriaceae bacterium]|jgi:hypothetical protein|nr:hypothetical protein [Bifidobacteriaceae bacterium]
MFRTSARKSLATLATGAMTAAALIVMAQPAAAADDPLRLGSLQVTPASGQIDAANKTGWLESASTDAGQVCPAGYRYSSELIPYIDGVRVPGLVAAWAMLAGDTAMAPSISGLDDGDTHIYRTGSYIISPHASVTFPWTAVAPQGGTVELRHTCEDSYGYGEGFDPYYSVTIEVQPGGAWQVLGAPPAPASYDSSESDINFELPPITSPPTPPTGLKITVKPGATTLTGPATREPGQIWTATGALGNVTVNDDRRDSTADAWTLNGKASDFAATGQDPISSANLGWTPAKVSGAGTAGAVVAPGVGGGLSVDQALATGSASDEQDVTTTVDAALTLDVPADVNAEGGSFKSTLTLTLI